MASNEAVVCRSQATQTTADPRLGDDQEGCHQPCQAQSKRCRVQRLDPFFAAALANGKTTMETLIDSLWRTSCTTWRRSLSCKRFALLYTALETEALEQGEAAPSAGAPGVHCSGSWLPMRLAGHNRGQERRSQQPFPSLTELDPETSGCHC